MHPSISPIVAFLLTGVQALAHPVPDSSKWLVYPGADGPGKGKHVVLISADQEYRSEQSMPMMAKILSKHHGFDCTVLAPESPLYQHLLGSHRGDLLENPSLMVLEVS